MCFLLLVSSDDGHCAQANTSVITVGFLTNILGSRVEEWSKLQHRLNTFAQDPHLSLEFSSMAIDMWDIKKESRKSYRQQLEKQHSNILSQFDQVLYFATGTSRGTMNQHLRSSLTYYRHWVSTFDLIGTAGDESANVFAEPIGQLPMLLPGMDARYDREFNVTDAHSVLNDVSRQALFYTDFGCYDTYKHFEAREMSHVNQFRLHVRGRSASPPKLQTKRVATGFLTRGPWCPSTRVFAFSPGKLDRVMELFRFWRRFPFVRFEHSTCVALREDEWVHVNEPTTCRVEKSTTFP